MPGNVVPPWSRGTVDVELERHGTMDDGVGRPTVEEVRVSLRPMSGAIFVMAGPVTRQRGPVAALVSTAGWAQAAQRVLGRSWIVTAGGVIDPSQARARGASPPRARVRAPGMRRALPTIVKTAVKDSRQLRRARGFSIAPDGPWVDTDVRFVWQRHELFETAGLELARALDVPSVLFVPATLVWEANQWGVRRPGWGPYLERRHEGPALRWADAVACGSDDVAEQVLRLGADPDRILVTPTGVDLDLFDRDADPARTRSGLGVNDHFVIGWAGSFRRFHALELLVEAARGIDDACLLLVGDGPERQRIEALARRNGVRFVSTGTVPHGELPEVLAAMDVAVVTADGTARFHYSPLKIAEYLAAGLPVVAPTAGQLAERLHDGSDALLVEPGDSGALQQALRRLRDDPALRERLATGARIAARRSWSWDHQVRRVVDALDALPRVLC